MKTATEWPKKTVYWIKGRTLYASIPFTWELEAVGDKLAQSSFEWDKAVIGGPAVKLVPDVFNWMKHVTTGDHYPNVLQRVNPMATRTTVGCIRSCEFCGVQKLEGKFRELLDWPDLPIICDNNLLAASDRHFDRVIERLRGHKNVEFSFGLDCRLLTNPRAKLLASLNLKKRGVRIALDYPDYIDQWSTAVDMLQGAGVAKRNIASFALIGFNSGPVEAWDRCNFIEKSGVCVLPVWFHPLNAHQRNIVTRVQMSLGWTDYERRRIMQWFYQHKDAVKEKAWHPDPWKPKH